MTICALCLSSFQARTSYGICPQCYSRDNLRAFDKLESATHLAHRNQVPASLTLPEMLIRISEFNGRCALCQRYPYSEIALLDPATGLVLSNVVPACQACAIHVRNGFDTAMQRVRDFLATSGEAEEMRLPDDWLDV